MFSTNIKIRPNEQKPVHSGRRPSCFSTGSRLADDDDVFRGRIFFGVGRAARDRRRT